MAWQLAALGVVCGLGCSSSALAAQWSWPDMANTSNQSAVAQSIEGLGYASTLSSVAVNVVSGLNGDNDRAPALLNSLSGDTHAGVANSLVSLGALAPSLGMQRLHTTLTASYQPGAAVAQAQGVLPASAWPTSTALPLWTQVVGNWRNVDGDANNARMTQRTVGVVVGMDSELAQTGWRVAGALGLMDTDGKVRSRTSESDVNSYSLTVFGGKSFAQGAGHINVLGGVSYTHHDIKTSRNVAFLDQTLRAKYSGHNTQMFAELGYALGQYQKFGFEPYVGLSIGEQRVGRFQEAGGSAALNSGADSDTLIHSTLGIRMHQDTKFLGNATRLRATVGWKHALQDADTRKTMAFTGGQNFTVSGTPLSRNVGLLGAEAYMALSRYSAVSVGLNAEFGGMQREHGAFLKWHWTY